MKFDEPDDVASICRSWGASRHGKKNFYRYEQRRKREIISVPDIPADSLTDGNALPVRCAPQPRVNRRRNADKSELFNRRNDPMREKNFSFRELILLFFNAFFLNLCINIASLVDWLIWSVATRLRKYARPISTRLTTGQQTPHHTYTR